MTLTPEFGPLVRAAYIITEAELEYDPPVTELIRGQTLASTRKGMCFGGIWQINESYPALRFVDTFYAIYSCI